MYALAASAIDVARRGRSKIVSTRDSTPAVAKSNGKRAFQSMNVSIRPLK